MKIPNSLKKIGIEQAIGYLEKDPVANIPKLLNWVDRLSHGSFATQRRYFHMVVDDKDNNWYSLIMDILTNVDKNVLKTTFTNFFLNANIIGWETQDACREKYGCNIPWAILLDPTSACNLHCKGCWAAQYGNKLNLTFDDIDSIVEQGKALGCYMYIYTGGEPLVRKDDIIKLCEKHSDCEFMSFTNGTLLDDKFTDDMLRVCNFMPVVSVEGDEKTTDARRGEGTYKKVVAAMDRLKAKKLPFGISACTTSENVRTICSSEYYDQMIEWGAKFCWFFAYMPVGVDAVPSLMLNAEQREWMYHTIRDFRYKKSLFTLDFFNDGQYVGGCIAGGKRYLHINANGDMDPCVFMHYSDSNIHEKTLLEGLRSPMFMAYHDNQPFNDNMLRPCPVIDNPGRLVDMVNKTGAHNTDPMAHESAEEFTAKCVDIAAKWMPVADSLWAEDRRIRAEKNAEEEKVAAGGEK